ncbi:unnamed protein product [Echinostoma caproni]|uniref:G_PROTEIN_RECEP_F1_2 domain-containing protein n=1 Tax=Echinostoma caproni TaxID=27848 RepID=A0A183ARE8_9TREM|nr:unnamed protein product [Echinostoma caproni]
MQTNGANPNQLAFPPISDREVASISFILSGGVLFNLYSCLALSRTHIPSTLSKLLLYNQCVLDAALSLIVVSMIASGNYTLLFPQDRANPVVCALLQSGFISRLIRIMILCNIVCQSVDRFWAIVYPNTYFMHTKRYVMVCYTMIPTYALAASIFRLFKVNFVDGQCERQELDLSPQAIRAIEIVLRYTIPMIVSCSLNLTVVWKLHHLGIFKSWMVSNTQAAGNTSGQTDSTDPLVSLRNRIFLSTFGLNVELTMQEIVSITLTVLHYQGVLNFGLQSKIRIYFLFGIALCSGLNPVLPIITVEPLRNTMLRDLRCFKPRG